VLITYTKSWRIEVFFRTVKKELGFEQCYSTMEAHHQAHFELLITAETLLAYALWQLNKEKTSDEGYTHGEMVRGLTTLVVRFESTTTWFSKSSYQDFQQGI
jgi:hypothetical protein